MFMVLVVYAKNLCGRHLSASAMRELYLLLQENTADEQAHGRRRVGKVVRRWRASIIGANERLRQTGTMNVRG